MTHPRSPSVVSLWAGWHLLSRVSELSALRESSDGELARRIAAPGHAPREEAELCARFGARVRLYGLRHLRDAVAAEDLVQRVLLLVLEKLRAGEVREPERVASFILGSARMIAKEMRRGSTREVALDGEMHHARADHRADPLASDHLHRCIEGLTERERTVILLSFYGDRSAAEVASSLSLEEGNVRVIRHRAVRRLRTCMDGGGAEGSPS
jgi:RNA polymerase sigma-70 factor, ECF subfamily